MALGLVFCHVWRLLPAIFEYTGEQGFSALSGSMLKKTLRAMKKPQNKTCGPSASSKQYWLPLSLGGTLTTWVTGPIQPDFFPPWKWDQSNMCSCKKKKGCHRHMIIGGDQSILLRPVYGSLDGWRMRCQCAKKEWIQVAWKLPNGHGLCCY